jgi:Flp pilus assembly pilin Flp
MMHRPTRVTPPADERGASAAEYALLVSLIALFVFASVTAVGVNLNGLYNRSCDDVAGIAGGATC